jgi:endonuclease I
VILFPIFFSCIFAGAEAQSAALSEKIPYYGEEFYQDLNAGVADKNLAMRIKLLLKSYHTPQAGALDQITPACNGPKCYTHVAVGYDAARVFMFGKFYLIKDGKGYGVKDVYCDKNHMSEDFKNGNAPAPGVVPDGTVINAEHTWPQSRFSGRYSTTMQKSDIHHLFPTDSQMNSIRGNGWFGEVVRDTKNLKCRNVRFGRTSAGGTDVFEPPKEHRGNLARALFYFSTRYDMPIDPNLEAFLRKWNRDDLVDDEELDRNNQIFALQGNRNPFIDYPELADKLSDF